MLAEINENVQIIPQDMWKERAPCPTTFLATRRFKALVDDWTCEEFGGFFWLTAKDMLQVRGW